MVTILDNDRLKHNGEKTGPQSGYIDLTAARGLLSTILDGGSGYPNVNCEYPPNWSTWRKMDACPPLVLAKAVKTAPMAVGWNWKKGKKKLPLLDQILDDMQTRWDPMLVGLIDDLCNALSFGCQSFELVWDTLTDGTNGLPSVRRIIRKIKPLLQDITRVRIYQEDGGFAGLVNGSVPLDINECLHYPYDMKAGNWYGRPLHANCRDEFSEYQHDKTEAQKLSKKLSGVLVIAKILKGMARKADGSEIDRFEVAKTLVQGLGNSQGVVFESLAANKDDIMQNPDLLKLSDIMLEVLDTGNHSPALAASLEKRRHMHSEFHMAWRLPPRASLEGQFGTKAEAGVHGDIGIADTEAIHKQMIDLIRQHAINKELVVNYGEEYRDAVYPEPNPIKDEKREILKDFWDKLLANAPVLEMILTGVDLQQTAESIGIPLLEGQNLNAAQLPPPPAPTGPPPTPGQEQAIGGNFAKANAGLEASMAGLELNCGSGAGGFKPGNTCQKPGSGGGKAAKGGTSTKRVPKAKKPLAGSKEWQQQNAAPKPVVARVASADESTEKEWGEFTQEPGFSEADPRHSHIAQVLSAEGTDRAVVRKDGKIVGAISYAESEFNDEPFLLINHVGSIEKGVGGQLVGDVIKKAAKAGIGVSLEAVPEAAPFYEHIGFEPEAPGSKIYVMSAEQAQMVAGGYKPTADKSQSAGPPTPVPKKYRDSVSIIDGGGVQQHHTTAGAVESIKASGLRDSSNSVYGKGVYLTNASAGETGSRFDTTVDVELAPHKQLVVNRDIDVPKIIKDMTGKDPQHDPRAAEAMVKAGYGSIKFQPDAESNPDEQWTLVLDKSLIKVKGARPARKPTA